MNLVTIARDLSDNVDNLRFSEPVSVVYNPLNYASVPHEAYLRKYGKAKRKVVLVGMNPGPWGMAQNGVPFGEMGLVRDWLGITGRVGKPPLMHPKRPVSGFECTRSEASGKRLWGWVRDRYGTPDKFFATFMVVNYCPLAFFDKDGKNLTPDKIARGDRAALYEVCDRALKQTARVLEPEVLVGIGKFVADRANEAFEGEGRKVGRVTHPSPANPRANRGWVTIVERELADLGVAVP